MNPNSFVICRKGFKAMFKEYAKFPFTFTSSILHFKCNSVQKFWED